MLRFVSLSLLAACISCSRPSDDDTATSAHDATTRTVEATGAIGSGTTDPSLPTITHTAELKTALQVDPKADGWQTEAFNIRANQQLKMLGKLLIHPKTLDAARLRPLVTDDVACGDLRPTQQKIAYQSRAIVVHRGALDDQLAATPASAVSHGVDGLCKALLKLVEPWHDAEEVRFKFKLFGVVPTDDGVITRQYFAISGRTKRGMVEQNATWRIRWVVLAPGQPPRLASIDVEQFEEVETRTDHGPLFADCTESVLGGNPSYGAQFCYGNDHWRRQIENYLRVYQFGHNGLAVGDVNGDGRDDVYRCELGGLPNRLYIQQPDGSARDVSSESGVDLLDNTRAALLIDLDNDADQDLVVTLPRAVLFLENDGGGRFTQRVKTPPVPHGYSLAATDYDLDGDLDLYVCVYYAVGADAAEFPVPMPYYDANNGGHNVLFRNDGGWKFTDVTEASGMNENNHRFTFAAVWEDVDNDGDADLYVANDFGRNNLYRNDAGHFTDVATQIGLQDGVFGMSATSGDYNRDGRMDIYSGNMFSSAGSRITYQKRFKEGVPAELKQRFQHMARGNSLFENRADGTFRDVSVARGVTMGRWSWSSLFADINNDGWEDLLVANGFITGTMPDDL